MRRLINRGGLVAAARPGGRSASAGRRQPLSWRRRLVGASVWLLTFLLCLLVIWLIELLLATGEGPLAGLPIVLIVALVTLIVATLRPPLEGWLESPFFGNVFSIAAVIRRLGEELLNQRGVEAIAHRTLSRLGQTLRLSWATIQLSQDGPIGARHFDWSAGRRPTTTPPAAAAIGLSVSLEAEDDVIGSLTVGPPAALTDLRPLDRQLVVTSAPLVATVLRNAQLVEQLEAQVATLAEREHLLSELAARLVQAEEEERRRLALELHDEPLQLASLLARQLEELPATPLIDEARPMADEIVVALRVICHSLRPAVLDDFGLLVGLQQLVDELPGQRDLTGELIVEPAPAWWEGQLPTQLETALYRLVQEALAAAVRRSDVQRVTVRLTVAANRLTLVIGAAGSGATLSVAPAPSALTRLRMEERLRPWRGQIALPTGGEDGTILTATIPLEQRR